MAPCAHFSVGAGLPSRPQSTGRMVMRPLPLTSGGARLYQPRFHQRTRLFAIVRDHLDEFVRVYPARFAARFGPLRPEVEKGFRAFLHCGAPEDGFATFRCPGCGASFIVPFSCKHWLCPSCSAKRTLDWAAWLVTEVLYDQPHYHIVATMPTGATPSGTG